MFGKGVLTQQVELCMKLRLGSLLASSKGWERGCASVVAFLSDWALRPFMRVSKHYKPCTLNQKPETPL